MSTTCVRNPESRFVSDVDDLYEVVDGQRLELKPMGAHEALLASALFEFLAPYARQHKLGQVVSEMLFVLDATRDLKRRPGWV